MRELDVILEETITPRDLGCFAAVSSVIGDDVATQTLQDVIDVIDRSGLDVSTPYLADAFDWYKTPQKYRFWDAVSKGIIANHVNNRIEPDVASLLRRVVSTVGDEAYLCVGIYFEKGAYMVQLNECRRDDADLIGHISMVGKVFIKTLPTFDEFCAGDVMDYNTQHGYNPTSGIIKCYTEMFPLLNHDEATEVMRLHYDSFMASHENVYRWLPIFDEIL